MNIGLIGAGRIGKIHSEIITKHVKEAVIKTLSDPFMSDEIEAWAKGLGIKNVTKNHDDIFNDPEIEAVLICSPTNTHTDLIIAAAKAGKQIFCEKPISFDIEKIMEALKVVKECGVKLQIGFNRRFDHNIFELKKNVEAGTVGDVHIVKITSRDAAPPPVSYVKVSGGIFLDMTIHDFDQARYLANSDVTEVYAQGAVLIDPEIGEAGDVDSAIVLLKFENGALGVIDNSRKSGYGWDQRAEVHGSKGCIKADNDVATTVKHIYGDNVSSDAPLSSFQDRYELAYAKEVELFIEAVKNDTEVPVNGYDGLQPVLIALAATESLKTHQPVKVQKIEMI